MRPFRNVLAAAFLAAAIFPPSAFGHGVEVSDTGTTDSLRAIRFSYTTGEPMMYAKIRVYAPARPETEILQSITDRGGMFCFAPDERGRWRIEAEDGMGHKGAIVIEVDAPDSGGDRGDSKAAVGGLPRPAAIALGLSLILNFFAGWHFLGRGKSGARKKGGDHAH